MSLWKKTMDYLGLGPDDAYEGSDDGAAVDERAPRVQRGPENRRPRGHGEEPSGDVRTVPARPSFPSPDGRGRQAVIGDPAVNMRGEVRGAPSPARPGGRGAYPAPSLNTEPHTVRPRRFDEAQEVADKFKDGLPVIMNLESTERDVARRLIDFASGICYALDGSMEKVATGVYLLKPPAIRPRQGPYGYE